MVLANFILHEAQKGVLHANGCITSSVYRGVVVDMINPHTHLQVRYVTF